MAGMATAIVTVASVSSVAYQLAKLMLYKAAEVSTNTAIRLLSRKSASLGKVQFILMELDIEAKFKTVRSLLAAIEGDRVDLAVGSKDFIMVCATNVRDIMDSIFLTLTRVQDKMDVHAQQWFNQYRDLDVVDDLHLLKAECRMFDKRLETLIQCLSVPTADRPGAPHAGAPQGLLSHRIFGDSALSYNPLEDENSETERMMSILMAERAVKEAELAPTRPGGPVGPLLRTSSGSPAGADVVFEDPVFL